MSAQEALRLVHESGGSVQAAGGNLIIEAETEPPAQVIEALREHKTEIMAMVAKTDDWTREDWLTFCDERAAIAGFDGSLSRKEAEARAYSCCMIEWLNRHPELTDPQNCAWCEEPDQHGHAIFPFGNDNFGHTWLHMDCW